MKRIAAVFLLGGAFTVGLSSQAAASGDPAAVYLCSHGCGFSPVLSVGQLAGPELGDLICSPGSETPITVPLPIPNGNLPSPSLLVVVCKQ